MARQGSVAMALVSLPALAAGSMLAQAQVAADAQETAPVKRVIGLLAKMKSELQAEADKESEMYDKMVCWCDTTEKEKTTAVAQAEATIQDLQAEIEERSARFGTLATEIDALKKQIAEDTAALKEATALREKGAAEFRDEEKATVQAITNMKNAIAVLGKHQDLDRGLKDPKGASMVQITENEMTGLRVVLKDLAFQHEVLMARKASSSSKTSFLAISSTDKAKTAGSLSEQLHSALEKLGHSDSLPLKFAEKLLERSAKSTSAAKGGSFLQSDAKQPMFQSYASQSDGIYGILTQMLEEFEADLKRIQGDDSTSGTDYEAVAKAKEAQLTAGKARLDELEGEHAANTKALSDAKENLQMTTEQRAEDVEFLRNLKLTCNDLDSQWEARSKTRSDEIVAVSETIQILTEDDNHEQLKAGGVVLLQEASSTTAEMQMRRSKAVALLRKVARAPEFDGDDLLAAWHHRSSSSASSLAAGARSQLSTLAVSVQLDGFEKVKTMIDELVAELKVQQEEEVKFKAYCTKELDENEKATFNKNEEKKDLEATIAQLEALMEKLTAEIKAATENIAATKLDVKKASQSREDENAEFQTVVADQRATQDILAKALQRLKDFYAKKLTGDGPADNKLNALGREVSNYAPGANVLLQRGATVHKQTPPVHFTDYKTNSGSSQVMSLIDMIVGDSKKLEKEAIDGEYQAQADYEKFVKDSNALVKSLNEEITAKSKAHAQAKIDQGSAQSSHDLAVGELESLSQYETDLHNECDFVLKNFDIRQKARMQEMEAMQQAKAILSGSSA
eukprot:TRINITY_DN2793_c0_g3_i1.p1 TRINITY_DN2793_c0_g3~~TRINITY_DN2793_c0_g3_i1.p1  ORF type:complete len:796 (+),score=350.66 TRINITY_DN2793_c0_g3_i1:78-2465(+)